MCENYLLTNHKEDIMKIMESSEKERYFSININFLELFEADTNLGNALLTDPEASLKNWNESIFNVQNDLLKDLNDNYTLKNNVNCRIYSLPPWPHVSRTIFPGNEDAGKFLQVTGTVVRMSGRKLLEFQRQYICVKCKYPVIVEAQYEKRNIIKQPKKCTSPAGCNSKSLVTFGGLDSFNCKDYQEIKIQEDLSKLGVGTVPNHMTVTLEDDLVNICKPGENVTITGIVTRRWSEFNKGFTIIIDIVLKANHVQVNNSSVLSIAVSDELIQFFDGFWDTYRHEPLVGRNIILRSIAPEIYGVHLVKLAIAMVLAGGSVSIDNDTSTGIDRRCESHLLIVGDPGTGKSQMLKFASKIIPRSVLTTGVGSTAAGLTVTALMENGEWQLEAGALVMADGGICCIDEFNSMREHDRTSIHEAMEQQTISVAKAGIVCKLKTRCSILAACNPKGNIDLSKDLCVNVAMSSPLLSRFDLILLLRDVVNEANDRLLSGHLLNKTATLTADNMIWSVEKLQAYYAVIKKRNPKLGKEAEIILSTYYQLQRKFGSRNKSRTTVRLLESLIRLSQGHAKLMNHSNVEVMDAIFALLVTDLTMDFDSSFFNLKIDYNYFFDNPESLYWDITGKILEKLNLDYIFQMELEKAGVEPNRTHLEINENISQNELFKQTHSQDIPRKGLFSQRSRININSVSEVGHTKNDDAKYISSHSNETSRSGQNVIENSMDSGNFTKTDFSENSMLTQLPLSKVVDDLPKIPLNDPFIGRDSISLLNRPSTSKDTLWSKKLKVNSPENKVKNPPTLSKIVGMRSTMDIDLEFVDDLFKECTDNVGKSVTISTDLKERNSRKRSSKSLKNCSEKLSKIRDEIDGDFIKMVPSVNDDFAKFGMVIDWDLEGELDECTENIERQANHSPTDSPRKEQPKTENVDIENSSGSQKVPGNKENLKNNDPFVNLLSKFEFKPKEKKDIEQPNNVDSTAKTSLEYKSKDRFKFVSVKGNGNISEKTPSSVGQIHQLKSLDNNDEATNSSQPSQEPPKTTSLECKSKDKFKFVSVKGNRNILGKSLSSVGQIHELNSLEKNNEGTNSSQHSLEPPKSKSLECNSKERFKFVSVKGNILGKSLSSVGQIHENNNEGTNSSEPFKEQPKTPLVLSNVNLLPDDVSINKRYIMNSGKKITLKRLGYNLDFASLEKEIDNFDARISNLETNYKLKSFDSNGSSSSSTENHSSIIRSKSQTSSFGDKAIDLDIENDELFSQSMNPFDQGIQVPPRDKHKSLFDLSQNSKYQFIKKKYNFKKVDVKRMPKSDSTNSSD